MKVDASRGSNLATQRTFMRVAAVLLVLLVVVSLLVIFSWDNSPARLLSKAREIQTTVPTRALELIRKGINASGGDFPDAQLVECRVLITLRRSNEATRCFAAIRRPAECSPKELVTLARESEKAGQFALAGQALEAAGEFVRKSPQLLRQMIEIIYTQNTEGREDEILQLCREYACMVSGDAFPWLVSASLYHERGEYQLAFHAYREVLSRNPPAKEVIRVRLLLMQVAMILGDVSTAREHFDALQANNLDSASQKSLALASADLLYREGKAEQSVKVLDLLLAKHADMNIARALRGSCKFDLGDYPGAICDLALIVDQDDFDQRAHYKLGQAYLRLEKHDQANRHLNRSRELTDLTAQILTLENRLANDKYNREIKLELADLNVKRGNLPAAANWRRGAQQYLKPH